MRLGVFVVVLTLVPPSSVIGQDAVPQLEPGQRVRLLAPHEIVGTIVAVRSDTLVIDASSARHVIPLSLITKLEVSPAHARQALMDVEVQRGLRITMNGAERVEGMLDGLTVDAITLHGQEAIAYEMIDSVWTRGRATKTGAIIGGTIGAAVGGVGLAILSGFCGIDSGTQSSCPGAGASAVIGVLVGGASGALVGGVLGAATGTWRLRYPTDAWKQIPLTRNAVAPTGTAVVPQAGGGIGSASASVRSAYILDVGGALGGGVCLLANLGPVALGPEVSYYRAVDGQSVTSMGGVFRVLPFRRQVIAPYGMLDVGYYRWRTSTYASSLGYGIGGGLRLQRPESRWTFGVEARFESNAQNLSDTGGTSFVSLHLEAALAW